jgi:hypothetical protein
MMHALPIHMRYRVDYALHALVVAAVGPWACSAPMRWCQPAASLLASHASPGNETPQGHARGGVFM